MSGTAERLGPAAAARLALRALESGRSVTVVTLVDPLRAAPPRRVVVDGAGRGSLGDARLDAAADAAATQACAAGDANAADARRVRIADADATLLLEPHLPQDELVIVGAGHIAVPLAAMARTVGFRVLVLDDREAFATGERFPEDVRVQRVDFDGDPFADVAIGGSTYVVLVTRAHRYDFDCLRRLLGRPGPAPAYLGVIGSRRRIRAAFHALVEGGFDAGVLAGVRAPVGLDIGAETPAEIAVSIVAEMVARRRGVLDAEQVGRPLALRERVAARFFGVAADG